jgi:hypothetical protein
MTAFTRRAALVLAACGLATLSLTMGSAGRALAAGADGKAQGTLTVNGKTIDVAYAYARSVPGFADPSTKDIQVIVSDVPLDGNALADEFARIGMAKNGKLHAFEITIDATGTPVSTAWRHDGFKGPMPSGINSADVLTKTALDETVIEASYKSAAPEEFFDNTYAFDVSFRAAIAH